eukprot:gene1482-4408_t
MFAAVRFLYALGFAFGVDADGTEHYGEARRLGNRGPEGRPQANLRGRRAGAGGRRQPAGRWSRQQKSREGPPAERARQLRGPGARAAAVPPASLPCTLSGEGCREEFAAALR